MDASTGSAFYVYYRVGNPGSPEWHQRAQAFVRDVGAAGGVVATLLVRRGDAALWMETYEGVTDPEAFAALLAERVARWKMNELLAAGAERRSECFDKV